MTGSHWIDLAIVLIAFVAATSGWRQGAVAGILIAPHVLVHVDEGRGRVLVGIALILSLIHI